MPDDPLEVVQGLDYAWMSGEGSLSDSLLPLMELFKAIALVLALILVAAFFVAAEIALISLREGQVKQLKGKRGARVAKLTQNPNR